MAIAEQELIEPATQLPRDARPSELVRGWPEDRWTADALIRSGPNGARYCALGILAEMAGLLDLVDVVRGIQSAYGIPYGVLGPMVIANNAYGKDAAADVLEAAGF